MKTTASCARGRRPGWSAIELLVVIGIIGLLIGLTLPAIQAAREAARRAQCASRLRQMILATHAFSTSRGGFPGAVASGLVIGPDGRPDSNYVGLHARLLPYLEQEAAFDSLNLATPCFFFDDLGRENATAARTSLAVFLCPSDPNGIGGTYGCTSYRGNAGLNELRIQPPGTAREIESGAFILGRETLPLSEFGDGLSNTLAFSEKPIGSGGAAPYSAFRDWIVRDVPRDNPDATVSACASLSDASAANTQGGRTWVLAGAIYTLFTTQAPPNDPVPDCGLNHNNGAGLFTARSYHPGGVEAAMADGSVRWMSSTTAIAVWRALGTRNRGD